MLSQIPFVDDPDEELETIEKEEQQALEKQQAIFGKFSNKPPDEEEIDDATFASIDIYCVFQ